MKLFRILRITLGIVVILGLLIVALQFSRKDTSTSFHQIQVGMTEQQVADLVGTPLVAAPEQNHVAIWNYGSGTVSFVNAKVEKISPK